MSSKVYSNLWGLGWLIHSGEVWGEVFWSTEGRSAEEGDVTIEMARVDAWLGIARASPPPPEAIPPRGKKHFQNNIFFQKRGLTTPVEPVVIVVFR